MKKNPTTPKEVKKGEEILFGGQLFKWLRIHVGLLDNHVRVKEKRGQGICTYSLMKKIEEGKHMVLDPFIKCGERTPMKEVDLLKAVKDAVETLNNPIKEKKK